MYKSEGIPSYGDGIVCVDSDEHTEEGVITEDPQIRKAMVDKRLGKLDEIAKELFPLEFVGPRDYKTLVVAWGSTYSAIKEAVSKMPETAFLCLRQLYPLHPDIKAYLIDAEEIVIVENNATSQLSKLLRIKFQLQIQDTKSLNRRLPFSVEEVFIKNWRG